MFGFKLLILFTCLSWSFCKLDKYCSLCEDHTLCKYQGIGKECEGGGESGVTEEDKKEIVEIHNWFRGIIASGSEIKGDGGFQPKAANLMKFEWDDELAKVAQRWADQCEFRHDTCRDDPRWKVGQNIYWAWKYPNHQANWTEAILSWYNEVSLFNPKDVDSYRFEGATGHYTQMLWHDTYAIGCGRKDYGSNKLYVCNYGPAGNWVGEPLYEIGEPCSKCPEKTVCDSFLCAKTKCPAKDEQTVSVDSNLLEKKSLETFKPAAEAAGEDEKASGCRIYNQTQEKETNNNLIIKVLNGDALNFEEPPKATTNSIIENEIDLDADIQFKIEEIKNQIENIVKSAIKKSKSNPKQ